MRFVYILEDEPKFQKELVQAIHSIDPAIQIRLFSHLNEFIEWLRTMMTEGPSAISKGGQLQTFVQQPPPTEEAHQLVAIISKIEFLGRKQLDLMNKTRKLFIERKVCTEADPTAFVLTAFDNPDFKIEELQDRILSNVIFKPFDRLILTQHLTFAIDGRHPPSKYTIANQKMNAVVEMLKQVEMRDLSEIGFTTSSPTQIDPGSFSKYYGPSFSSERVSSVMARMVDCRPDPTTPNQFICSFLYFAADPTQITNIRKKIKAAKKYISPINWKDLSSHKRPSRDLNIIFIDDDDFTAPGLIDSVQRHFMNVRCLSYANATDFFVDIDPKLVENSAAPPPKAFSLNDFELVFDDKLSTINAYNSAAKEPLILFGSKFDEIKGKKNWLQDKMDQQHLDKWKKWIDKPTPDAVFVVQTGGNRFYIRPVSFQKKEKEMLVKFVELSAAERSNFLSKNSQLPQQIDYIFLSHRFLGENGNERWQNIKEKIIKRSNNQCDPKLYIMAAKHYSDIEERELANQFTDIFFKPIDRSYFLQKLKYELMALPNSGDPIEMPFIPAKEKIRAANPAPVTEISEAGLIMQYNRKLDIGSFREFLLWQAYEHGAPIMKAQCNFVEETGQKEVYNIHFVFYGITDLFLKTIRIWIRDNYIQSKEKG